MELGLLEALDVTSELSNWLVRESAPLPFVFTILPEDLGLGLLVRQACNVIHVDLFVATVRRSVGVSPGSV